MPPNQISSSTPLSLQSSLALRAERQEVATKSSFWDKWSNLSTGQKWGRALAWLIPPLGVGIQAGANLWQNRQAKAAAARPREDSIQQSDKNINNIPLRSHAVFGSNQRAAMGADLAIHPDILNPNLSKGENGASFHGLADTFEKDVKRDAEVHLKPSSGEGMVTINKHTPEPGNALRDFFKAEFPNDDQTAENWSVLTSKYANQITNMVVNAFNTQISGFRCTKGKNSQENFVLRMEQGGKSALLESRIVGGIQNILREDGKGFVAEGSDDRIDWKKSKMEETLLLRLTLGPPEAAQVISAFTKHNLVTIQPKEDRELDAV